MSEQIFAELVRHAEGDVPTTAELNRMRSFVLEAADQTDVEPIDVHVLPPTELDHGASMSRTTQILVGLAAAVLLIVGIVALTGGDDTDDNDIVDTITPTTTEAPDPEPEPEADPEPDPQPETGEPESNADTSDGDPDDAETSSAPEGTVLLDAITQVPIQLDSERYFVDSVGTELILDIGERWTAHRNTQGRLVLGDAFTQGPGDNDIVFIRAAELIDPMQPTRVNEEWLWGPSDDIDAWLAAASTGLGISDIRTTEVSGYPATTFDVVIDPDQLDCISKGCVRLATNGSTYALLGTADRYRVWYVEQGEFEPLVIVASGERSPDEFVARADALVETIELGEAMPMLELDG